MKFVIEINESEPSSSRPPYLFATIVKFKDGKEDMNCALQSRTLLLSEKDKANGVSEDANRALITRNFMAAITDIIGRAFAPTIYSQPNPAPAQKTDQA